MVASLIVVVPPMFIPSELGAPMRLASSYEVISLAPVFLASSRALPTWSKWPCVTRMASRVLGWSSFGALGLSSQGSMAMVAPPGVVMIQAAWPHQVAVVTPAGAGFSAAGAAGAAAGLAAALADEGTKAEQTKAKESAASGNETFFMGLSWCQGEERSKCKRSGSV